MKTLTPTIRYAILAIIAIILIPLWPIFLYLLPIIVASKRRHNNEGAIAVITIFLGWTFLGWVIALAWSFSDNTRKENPPAQLI